MLAISKHGCCIFYRARNEERVRDLDMLSAMKALGMQDWEFIRQVRREGRVKDLPSVNAPATDREIIAILKTRGVKVDTREDPTNQEKELQLLNVAATKWVSCGMQQVEMGHKFAAALLVSTVSKELLDQVKMPWPAFMIVVPNDMIFMSNPADENKPTQVNRIMAFEVDNRHGKWAYLAWARNMDLTLWRFGVTAEYLLPATIDPNYWGDSYVTSDLKLTDLDTTASVLIGRLIITTCISMTMPEMISARNAKTHEMWKKAKGDPLNLDRSKEPMPQVWSVGKPITMDFRDRVREFATGQKTDRTLEVRRMVIGHFKQQVFGKGRKDRRNQWIEPYWRGPEEAAINVSPHVIKEKE